MKPWLFLLVAMFVPLAANAAVAAEPTWVPDTAPATGENSLEVLAGSGIHAPDELGHPSASLVFRQKDRGGRVIDESRAAISDQDCDDNAGTLTLVDARTGQPKKTVDFTLGLPGTYDEMAKLICVAHAQATGKPPSPLPPWPAAQMQSAVAECQQTTRSGIESKYLAEHHQTALMPADHAGLQSRIAKMQAFCTCSLNKIQKLWTLAHFQSHPGDQKFMILVLGRGPCRPSNDPSTATDTPRPASP